jgi:uncharacterized protein (TIRG00374 family)
MRKILLLALGLLALAYIVFSLAEIESILATLRRTNPIYLVAAVIVEAVVLVNSAATFTALYRLVGLHETRQRMFLMVAAGNFVNVIVPSGGMGGMAVFMDAARRRGLSTGRVVVVGVLYLVYEYASLLAVLAAGFVVLLRRGRLDGTELAGAGLLLGLAGCIGVVLVVGYRSTRQLGNLLAWLANGVNRLLRPFVHRDWLSLSAARVFADEMGQGFSTLRLNRKHTALPLALTLVNKVLLIAVLTLSFLALGTPFSRGTVVAGFSIGHLFYYVSPTPSGVGFVDSILPVALNTLNVPFAQAVLVVLVYRTVTFWLPLGLGALAFRFLQKSLAAETHLVESQQVALAAEAWVPSEPPN